MSAGGGDSSAWLAAYEANKAELVALESPGACECPRLDDCGDLEGDAYCQPVRE